jgi:hypothetical protein
MHPWLRVRKYGFWLAYAAVALYVVLFITKNFLNNPMIYYSYVGWTIWIGGAGAAMVVLYLLMRLGGYAPPNNT